MSSRQCLRSVQGGGEMKHLRKDIHQAIGRRRTKPFWKACELHDRLQAHGRHHRRVVAHLVLKASSQGIDRHHDHTRVKILNHTTIFSCCYALNARRCLLGSIFRLSSTAVLPKRHLRHHRRSSHLVNLSKMRANGGFCSPSLREKGFTSHTTAFATTGRSPGPSSPPPPSSPSSPAVPPPPSTVGSGSMSSFVPCGWKKQHQDCRSPYRVAAWKVEHETIGGKRASRRSWRGGDYA